MPYLEKLKSKVKETFPKSKLNSLLDLVVTEAKCEGMQLSRNGSKQTLLSSEMQDQDSEGPIRKKQKIENGDQHGDIEMVDRQQNKSSERDSACDKCEKNGKSNSNISEKLTEKSRDIDTRVVTSVCDEKQRGTEFAESSVKHEETPLFYHDLHKKKFHATVLPK